MTRLVAFGCSNTLGESLSDCVTHSDPAKSTASRWAWPCCLAKLWHCSVLNLGHAGASNKFIARTVLEFDFHSRDCVVILWSSFARSCVFKPCRDFDYQRLLPADTARSSHELTGAVDRNATKAYYRLLHSDEDSCFNSFVLMHCVKQHLDRASIPNHHFTWWKGFESPAWNQVPLTVIDLEQLPRASDGEHPSIQAHSAIAQQMNAAVQKQP